MCFHATLAVNFEMYENAILIYSRIVGFVTLRCEECLFIRMDKSKIQQVMFCSPFKLTSVLCLISTHIVQYIYFIM